MSHLTPFSLCVPLKIYSHAKDLPIPEYATAGSAGLDLLAAINTNVVLLPGEWKAIPSGIAFALPPGWEGQVRSRSGLALKHGIIVLQGVGTIDSDYRDEVKVLLYNKGQESFTIKRHMRIAQLILAQYGQAIWDVREELPPASTERKGGFGSTGLGIA